MTDVVWPPDGNEPYDYRAVLRELVTLRRAMREDVEEPGRYEAFMALWHKAEALVGNPQAE